ncbi:MAG TPA: cytochrome c [Burkholderiales bacterium]|nr:cytochrome c [Burkholderiales bacterium]
MIAATCTQSVMGSALSADIEHGRQIYATYCANCHGVRGVPVMPGAPDFTRPETLLQPDPVLVNKVKAGKNAMPAFQGLLRDRDLFDVVAYLRLLR